MSLAQNDNITPQVFSPNAAELGKYGRVPVNYFNGLPNITIPLTEIRAKNYTLPIYLTYHASGNKPDQHPGWVGQGWTLHAGGCINRIINGAKDELTKTETFYIYGSSNPSVNSGYLYHMSEMQSSNWSNLTYLHHTWHSAPYLDYEPDEYQINIEDIQASFYMTGNGQIAIVSRGASDFEVSYVMSSQSVSSRGVVVYEGSRDTYAKTYSFISEFIVTKNDGTRYYFGGDTDAIEFSAEQMPNFFEGIGGGVGSETWDLSAVANTWMLTKIERPDGEIIFFKYRRDGVPIVFSDSYSAKMYYVSDEYCHKYDPIDDDYHLYKRFFFLIPSYLESVHCRYGTDSLSFRTSHSVQLDYDYTQEEFEYRVGYPMPYENIRSQSYYVQVDSIVSSRGVVRFDYTKSADTRLKLNEVQLCVDNVAEMSYRMSYNPTPLPRYNSRKTDQWGYYNSMTAYSVRPYETLAQRRSFVNVNLLQAEMLTRITWPTGGWTEFEYEPHDYSKVAGQFPFCLYSSSGQVGGLRIKKMTDNLSDNSSVSKIFQYSDNGISSGILSNNPVHYTSGNHYVNIHFGEWMGLMYYHIDSEYDATYYYFSERELNQLSLTDGCHVTYSKVTELSQEAGTTEYTYYNHDDPDMDCMDRSPAAVVERIDNKVIYNSFSSMQLSRGLLKSRKVKDANSRLLTKEEYQYSQDTTNAISSVRGFMEYDTTFYRVSYYKIFTFFPALTRKTVTTWPECEGTPTVETIDYEWDSHRRLKRTTTSVVKPENENVPSDTLIEERFYAADYLQGGVGGVNYPAMTALGMGGVPVEKVLSRDGKLVTAELTEWKYFPSSDCYLPFRKSSATPSEYAYSGGGLYNGRVRMVPYNREEDTILNYDSSCNPVEIKLSDSRYAIFTWDSHGRLRGRFLCARRNTVDRVWPEVFDSLDVVNLSTKNSPQYNYPIYTDTTGRLSITLSCLDGIPRPIWGRVGPDSDSLFFYCPSSELSGGQYWSHTFYDVPAGWHNIRLTTDPDHWLPVNIAEGVYYDTFPSPSDPSINPPVDPDEPIGPVEPGPFNPGTQIQNPDGTPLWGEMGLRFSVRHDVHHLRDEQEVVHLGFEADGDYTSEGFNSSRARLDSLSLTVTLNLDKLYYIDKQVLRNGHWEYERSTLTPNLEGHYTISAGGLPFDEVRIYPVDAEVETYTWWPDGNLRSRTDGRGVTESFVYDAFGRLIEVRDTDGNRVEGYDYHYATHLDMVGL